MNPLLKKIRQYDLENDYPDIIIYKKTNTLPNRNMNTQQKNRFIEKYKPFDIRNNKLYFENLLVIQKKDIDSILNPLYKEYYFLASQEKFYDLVQSKYLNISRNEVIRFLKSQSTYQLTFRPNETKKRPLRKYKNEDDAWALDLIDLNYYAGSNRNFKWIMTIIDVVTHKVFLIELRV